MVKRPGPVCTGVFPNLGAVCADQRVDGCHWSGQRDQPSGCGLWCPNWRGLFCRI